MISNKQVNFLTYKAAFKSTAILAANTPETVISPAANVNGVIIHSAQMAAINTGYSASMVAKSSAPANVADGDVIVVGKAFNTSAMLHGELSNPIKIDAGKGVYFISTSAENNNALRSVLYTLL